MNKPPKKVEKNDVCILARELGYKDIDRIVGNHKFNSDELEVLKKCLDKVAKEKEK